MRSSVRIGLLGFVVLAGVTGCRNKKTPPPAARPAPTVTTDGRPRRFCLTEAIGHARASARPDAVQDMTPQRMTFRHARVVEVLARVMAHAESFHDAARARVLGHREGHDLR